jgi:hypothetical protein
MPKSNFRAMAFLLLALAGAAAPDEPKTSEAMKAARANWALLDLGEPALHETAHLVLVAPKGLQGRLKDVGAYLEKHYGMAEKVLKLDSLVWTVYIFNEREAFNKHLLRVENRRLDPGLTGGYLAEGDTPRVFVGPPPSKPMAGLETQAAEQLAAALLQRKVGAKVILPDWLLAGFGRATVWRVNPNDESTRKARQQASSLVTLKKRTAQQVWGTGLDPEEAAVLQPMLADLLAYGPGSSKFPELLAGFRPDEGQARKTTEQALDAAGIKVPNLEQIWPAFVRNPSK